MDSQAGLKALQRFEVSSETVSETRECNDIPVQNKIILTKDGRIRVAARNLTFC